MIVVWLLAAGCSSEHVCTIKEISKPAQAIGRLGRYSTKFKGLLEGLGYESNITTEEYDGGPLPAGEMFISSLTLGIMFMFFVYILLFWFLLGQLTVCCCCFRPKNTEKYTKCKLIHHIFSMIVLNVAAALILTAVIFITIAIDKITLMNPESQDSYLQIGQTIVNISMNTIYEMQQQYYDAYNCSKNLYQVYTRFDQCGSLAQSSLNAINTFSAYFDPSASTDLKNRINSFNSIAQSISEYDMGVYENTFGHLKDYFVDVQVGKIKSLPNYILSIPAATIEISKEQARQAFNIYDFFIKGQLESLVPIIHNDKVSQIYNANDYTFENFEGVLHVIDISRTYILIICYFGLALIVFIPIIYGILFFFNGSCTRCMFSWFNCFGFLITLVTIMLGVAFSTYYMIIFGICPHIPEIIADSSAEKLNITKEHFIEMLKCEDDNMSIYEDGFQNTLQINQIYHSLYMDFMSEGVNNILTDKTIAENFKAIETFNISVALTTKSLTEAVLIKSKQDEELAKIVSQNQKMELSAAAELIYEILFQTEQGHPQEYINPAKDPMSKLTEVKSIVTTNFNKASSVLSHSYDYFKEQDEILESKLNELKCPATRCVYKPIHEALCVYLLDGMSIYIIAIMLAMIGVFSMSISVCRRRRGLKKIQIQSETDSEEDENGSGSEVERFARSQL